MIVGGGLDRESLPRLRNRGNVSHMANPLKNYRVTSRDFRPFDVAEISGVDADQQRDWKRRGFFAGRTGDVMEVTRFLLVRTLRDANFDLTEAWRLANDETVGWVVFQAAQLPNAWDDTRAGRVLKQSPSFSLPFGMELTGRRAVAAGPLLAWGPHLQAGLFPSYEAARANVDDDDDAPVLIHTLDLTWLPKTLIERAGVIGYVEKIQ